MWRWPVPETAKRHDIGVVGLGGGQHQIVIDERPVGEPVQGFQSSVKLVVWLRQALDRRQLLVPEKS